MFRFSNLVINRKIISTLESLSCMWILKIDGSNTGMNCGTQRNLKYHEGFLADVHTSLDTGSIKWKKVALEAAKSCYCGEKAKVHVLLSLHMLATDLFQ